MEKTLNVKGMMCANCQKHVHDALLAMDGVSTVDVSLEKGTAKVTASREIPMDEFKSVISEAGYELV
ncbi:heavy-metal-associated domain-containing protein [uncultured Acidaminococcus sp.]|jgi:copper chaperone CopZ|uniref:heavy-metal-associated domain-containing protein n=1 Tax=Acidaminococcus sp. TaxID=1872103 RepID=UPI002676479F|nr:heavy metal-associated domain-containing protein [uncultured Acidaminococcus sp.]